MNKEKVKKLYYVLHNKKTNKTFIKYFDTEEEMDKYKRRSPYFKNIMILEDSRGNWLWYND